MRYRNTLPALLALSIAAAPALAQAPCFSPHTFNEIFNQSPRPNALVLLVGTPGDTAEYWESTVWSDPELCAWLKQRNMALVLADATADAGLLWLLDIQRTPAAIVFDVSEERARRYGGSSADSAESIIEWIEGAFSGESIADQLAAKLKENPNDFETRFELISELNRSGEDARVFEQYCWLMLNADTWKAAADEQEGSPSSDAEFQLGIIWLISGMRENADLWTEENWSRAISAGFRAPPTTKDAIKLAALRAPILELRKELEARAKAGTASPLDKVALQALTIDQNDLRKLISDLTHKAYPADEAQTNP